MRATNLPVNNLKKWEWVPQSMKRCSRLISTLFGYNKETGLSRHDPRQVRHARWQHPTGPPHHDGDPTLAACLPIRPNHHRTRRKPHGQLHGLGLWGLGWLQPQGRAGPDGSCGQLADGHRPAGSGRPEDIGLSARVCERAYRGTHRYHRGPTAHLQPPRGTWRSKRRGGITGGRHRLQPHRRNPGRARLHLFSRAAADDSPTSLRPDSAARWEVPDR